MNEFTIREIRPGDNQALAAVIRNTLAEFGANHPGTVYYDPTTDRLFELFQKKGSIYYVAEKNNAIAGGSGIFPSNGLEPDTCELVKIYLVPEARGKGLGRQLLEKCLGFARRQGYRKVYIETMPELKQAVSIYEKYGFRHLKGPLGNTGHTGCAIWMLLEF